MKKILLVDDDEGLNAMLSLVLHKKKGNWELRSARSGDEALRILQTFRPDVAVLDMLMPGMSGLELTKKIKEDPQLSLCKVVALSAVDDPRLRRNFLAAGALDFWTKPVGISELEEHLSRLLDQ